MDQLTYRSGKWDIINVTLNNNILIYCAVNRTGHTGFKSRSAMRLDSFNVNLQTD